MATIAEMLNAAVKLHQAGNLPEAEKRYRQILQVNPLNVDVLHLLGALAHQVGRNELAVDYIGRALQLRPNFAEAHYNLGVTLAAQGKLDEAAASHQQALRLKPDYAEAHNNLGVVLKEQGKLPEAIASYQRALQLLPTLAEAHNNLGNALVSQDRLEEAAESYRQALALRPNFVEAHWNRALALLTLGHFEQGWPEYEWRLQRKDKQDRPFRQPLWDGAPLAGRTILLHAEQGLGDTLQFIRYAALVNERGGRVLVECQQPLLRLLRGCRGVEQWLPAGAPLPDFDVHAPLPSLPGIFGTNLRNIPAEVPYLSPDLRLVEQWRQELHTFPGFKAGIAWQGNPKHENDRQRSIPLAQFAPLAQVPGVHLLSLQKSHGTEQLREVANRFAIADLGSRLDEASGAFMDTAAVMTNLDLVITSDTATAHLAGALGVPVWVALTYAPDWRWLREREDSPWYPRMRLFRQRRRGDWAEVFERMARELTAKSRSPAMAPGIGVDIAPGELIDKITILEIKSARITDAAKRHNIHSELAMLSAARAHSIRASAELDALTAELKAVNERLWDIEDAIRLCERQEDFGARFIDLARSVYRTNDVRAALKRRINELLGSTIVEEKSYADYAGRSL